MAAMGSDDDRSLNLEAFEIAEMANSNANAIKVQVLDGYMSEELDSDCDSGSGSDSDSDSDSDPNNEPAEKKRCLGLDAAPQKDSQGLQSEHENGNDAGGDSIIVTELQPATATAGDQISHPGPGPDDPDAFASAASDAASSADELMSSGSDTLDLETGLPLRMIHSTPPSGELIAANNACQIIHQAMVQETLAAVTSTLEFEPGSQHGQDENVLNDSGHLSQLAQLLEEDPHHQPQILPEDAPSVSKSEAKFDSMTLPPVQIGLALPPLKESWEDAPLQAWRTKVAQILTQNGFDSVLWKRPMRLASLCSGLQTAHLGMLHLGVPFAELYAADLKDSCMKPAQNMQALPSHFFNSIREAKAQEGWCKIHAKVCRCEGKDTARVDMMVAGFPCSPFSTQRPQRFSSGAGSWRSHPDIQAMWDTADHIHQHEPYFAILENVLGFLRNSRTAIAFFQQHI